MEVFFATREGQARKVAERVGPALVDLGLEAAVHDVTDAEAATALARSEAVVLVGSVPLGKHERELLEFVRRTGARLDEMPSAFVSVCGAESGVEKGAQPEARAKAAEPRGGAAARVHRCNRLAPGARAARRGALVYTHYTRSCAG